MQAAIVNIINVQAEEALKTRPKESLIKSWLTQVTKVLDSIKIVFSRLVSNEKAVFDAYKNEAHQEQNGQNDNQSLISSSSNVHEDDDTASLASATGSLVNSSSTSVYDDDAVSLAPTIDGPPDVPDKPTAEHSPSNGG